MKSVLPWKMFSIWNKRVQEKLNKEIMVRSILKETLVNFGIQPLQDCFGYICDPIINEDPLNFVAVSIILNNSTVLA